jgi:hypothetical protein
MTEDFNPLICPSVQLHNQKNFSSLPPQIKFIPSTIPSQKRGAYRDRHERWVRDAVDASDATDESVILRTAKSCGPDASTLASSFRWGNPLKATVTKKPDHRGERAISR